VGESIFLAGPVDRLAPARDRRGLVRRYVAPQSLRPVRARVTPGPWLEEAGVYAHELDFRGGSLATLLEPLAGRDRSSLEVIRDLGFTVLSLGPIQGFTVHGYDTVDLAAVAPHLGDWDDLGRAVQAAHGLGLKVCLDLSLNHVSPRCAWYRTALADPAAPERATFEFDPRHAHGVRCWAGVRNLVRVQGPRVQAARRALLRRLAALGLDAVRLDVAEELGVEPVRDLTALARRLRPTLHVVSEVSQDVPAWRRRVGPVWDYGLGDVIVAAVAGRFAVDDAAAWTARWLRGMGATAVRLHRSWLLLDSHDTPTLAHRLPDPRARALAWTVAACLPLNLSVYYLSVAEVAAAGDPENRQPMPWSRIPVDGAVQRALALRARVPALRYGGYAPIAAPGLWAFRRDTVTVVVNPGVEAVRFAVGRGQRDLVTGERLRVRAGAVRVPGQSVVVVPDR
jgi:glycosidase